MGPGSKLEKSLKNLGRGLAPKALLVITAHWEANEVTVSTGTYKKLLFDYYVRVACGCRVCSCVW